MILLGSHCSLNGSEMFLGSVKEALSYNATALMVYTGAPQNTIRKSMSEMRVNEAQALMKENNLSLDNLIIHAPYIINPATNDSSKRDFCLSFLTSEVRRTAEMGGHIIVLHPGNSLDLSINEAIHNVYAIINQVLLNTKDLDVCIAIETMAGKGSEVGRTFEQIKEIIDNVIDKNRIGVCLDTCHINDAGYDLVNCYDEVKKEFDSIIGFKYLKVIHVNDSKNPLGSHKDRHENVGKGHIGFKTLYNIVHDEDFVDIPKILETPYIDGIPPYKEEIELLKK